MPKIQVLDSHVADLIAAGEVVERPASVVKELVENAIDAGATAITVELQNGGMTFLRVTDNGGGMEPADVATAFLRHATSKVRTAYDLEAIGTLGFRGEALAAIAAVSRVEVLTRQPQDELGTTFTVEGGKVVTEEPSGAPLGTTMVVRQLFYNTPARLKFMKKDSYEGAAALAVVQQQAMAHPEIAFTAIRDGKKLLTTPGDGQLKSAVYAVLGRDIALGLSEVHGSGEDGIKVTGFSSLPTCCRGSRSTQFFFVNGRFIRSRTLAVAVEEAYKNRHMVGRFPSCVIHIETRLSSVDVNVHPAKTEVKFVSNDKMFSAVHHAVKGALDGQTTRPVVKPTPVVAPITPPTPVGRGLAPAPPPSRPQAIKSVADTTTIHPSPLAVSQFRAPIVDSTGHLPLHDSMGADEVPVVPTIPVGNDPRVVPPPEIEPVGREPRPLGSADTQPLPSGAVRAPLPTPVIPPLSPWQVKGELFNTYIMVEQGETAFFIDKHAAHERINYDRLKAQDYQPMTQQLLVPVVVTPSPEEAALLLQHVVTLDAFGFQLESFGGDALLVRGAPDYVDAGDIEATLLELATKLQTAGHLNPQSARDALLATMACKAAIKGGQKNDPLELQKVAEAVLSGQVKYCPHGRPIALELTKAQLEKLCKRT